MPTPARGRRYGALAILAAAGLMMNAGAGAQSNAAAERFTANAVNISEIGAPGATQLDIVVERWSSEAERDGLVAAAQKGPQVLLETLQKNRRVGFLRSPESLGYEMRFSQQTATEEGGRRIILMTDRPIGFAEAVNRPFTIQYPFTVVELRLNKDSEGEGTITIATRITSNRRTKALELENLASQPVMLKEVRKQR